MINDLEQFSVERLESLAKLSSDNTVIFAVNEVTALARIALAAKSAEPVAWVTWHQGFRAPDDCEEYLNAYTHATEEKSCDGSSAFPVYDKPYLNTPEIPEGYKLVPVEPSLKMMEAAVTCEDASFDDDSDMICIHHEVIYKAMLAAAPAPEDS
ncbi:hypothetical protein [Rouxiella sp. Mn2063]|uniref:hypothetical protein n=1 Tax=Rouxiella sp. Mn2063 TaxID=3395262 RepID=UPI003BE20E6C